MDIFFLCGKIWFLICNYFEIEIIEMCQFVILRNVRCVSLSMGMQMVLEITWDSGARFSKRI